jgi:putative ABC transport system ATP-binding protein
MLVGPSGCGKTTLLSVIAGTLTPQTGTVEVFGQRLDGLSQEELTSFRRKHLGFVFQSFNLIPTLTVLENVMVPLLIQGAAQDVAVAKARAMLEKVGLKGREDGQPNALSGGQQQRVAIARALVHEPSLLICDEPTSALDKDTGAQIMQMVRDLSRSPERCVVVVTHDHRIFRFADRIAEMEDGRIRRVVEDAGLLDTNHL